MLALQPTRREGAARPDRDAATRKEGDPPSSTALAAKNLTEEELAKDEDVAAGPSARGSRWRRRWPTPRRERESLERAQADHGDVHPVRRRTGGTTTPAARRRAIRWSRRRSTRWSRRSSAPRPAHRRRRRSDALAAAALGQGPAGLEDPAVSELKTSRVHDPPLTPRRRRPRVRCKSRTTSRSSPRRPTSPSGAPPPPPLLAQFCGQIVRRLHKPLLPCVGRTRGRETRADPEEDSGARGGSKEDELARSRSAREERGATAAAIWAGRRRRHRRRPRRATAPTAAAAPTTTTAPTAATWRSATSCGASGARARARAAPGEPRRQALEDDARRR